MSLKGGHRYRQYKTLSSWLCGQYFEAVIPKLAIGSVDNTFYRGIFVSGKSLCIFTKRIFLVSSPRSFLFREEKIFSWNRETNMFL